MMSRSRIYLTLPIMQSAIQDVLSTEPYCHSRQLLFSLELRKRLIASIITRVRSDYQVFIDDAHAPCASAIESKTLLKDFVFQEMNELIQKNKIEFCRRSPLR